MSQMFCIISYFQVPFDEEMVRPSFLFVAYLKNLPYTLKCTVGVFFFIIIFTRPSFICLLPFDEAIIVVLPVELKPKFTFVFIFIVRI